MVVNGMGTVKTGGSGFMDNLLEIAVIGVTQHLGKVTAGPEFDSGRFVRRIRSKGD